eukprot:COSAG06_NODE_240_length_19339_cov_16.770582_5_plen_59_part_00
MCIYRLVVDGIMHFRKWGGGHSIRGLAFNLTAGAMVSLPTTPLKLLWSLLMGVTMLLR